MLLSQCLKQSRHQSTKTLCADFEHIIEIDDVGPIASMVTKLQLNHCALTSLEGIEQFTALTHVSLRHNDLEETNELHRISCKDSIVSLDFRGNHIEYLGGGLFINLVKIFPNLEEVNGKDYLAIIQKSRKPSKVMKKIANKVEKIKLDLQKTIKKEEASHPTFQNSIHHERPAAVQLPISHHASRRSQPSEPESEEESKSEVEYQEATPLKALQDISLGNLSNIPMTKSVRQSFRVSDKPLKKKELAIVTLLNESGQGRSPLSQPTATFAMHSQQGRQVFRREKTQRYSHVDEPIEEEWAVTCREAYHPEESSLMDIPEENVEEARMNRFQNRMFVNSYANNSLLSKALEAWKQFMVAKTKERVYKNEDRPLRMSFCM